MNKKYSLAMSAFSGALMAVCFSCPALQAGVFAALVPLWCALRGQKSYRRAWLQLFVWGAVYHLGVLHWLFAMAPLTRWGLGVLPSVLLLGCAVTAVAAVQGALLALPAACCAFYPGSAGAFACLFVLGEYLQGAAGELAFPWARIGMACTVRLWMQGAAVGGVLLLTLAAVLANAALGEALCRRKLRWALLAAGVLGVQLGIGAWAGCCGGAPGESRSVLLVQNVLQGDEKWDLTPAQVLQQNLQASAQAAPGTRWIVWNETDILTDLAQDAEMLRTAAAFAAQKNAVLLCGTLRQTGEGTPQNVALAVDGTGAGMCYAKRKLVPFGESLPLQVLWGHLAPNAQPNICAGQAAGPILLGDEPVGVAICYESAFPAVVGANARGAQALVVISNDSWFASPAAREQHCRHARFRAAEQGKWLLRAANTGITCAIRPNGQISAQLPCGTAGVLQTQIALRSGQTPYARLGDAAALPGAALAVYALGRIMLRRRRSLW